MGRTYIETFDDGPGGWFDWASNAEGPKALEQAPSAVISRSPWWVDYNHAPPGGGYLHLPFGLLTRPGSGRFTQHFQRVGGTNRFIDGGFGMDFTDAAVTLRLRGDAALRGAQLHLHVQAEVAGLFVNFVLTGQPLQIGTDWSEQTVTLRDEPSQWKCLGSRHDRTDDYGSGEIGQVLRDVNCDILLILYPLNVAADEPVAGDPHRLKAGEDYSLDRSLLPSGRIELDEVRIDFAP